MQAATYKAMLATVSNGRRTPRLPSSPDTAALNGRVPCGRYRNTGFKVLRYTASKAFEPRHLPHLSPDHRSAYSAVDSDLAAREQRLAQQAQEIARQMGELQEALSALGGRLEEVRDTRGRLRQLAAAQQQQAQQQAPALPPSNMTSVPSNDAHKSTAEELVYGVSCAAGDAAVFEPGSLVSGTVSAVRPYGAYIGLDGGGGATGFLHISELSSDYVRRVDDVLSKGDRVKAVVVGTDRHSGCTSLSTRALERSPGEMVADPCSVFERAEETLAARKRGVEASNSEGLVSQIKEAELAAAAEDAASGNAIGGGRAGGPAAALANANGGDGLRVTVIDDNGNQRDMSAEEVQRLLQSFRAG